MKNLCNLFKLIILKLINEDLLELLIKGLNVVFKHKTQNINKEIKTYNI